MKPLKVFSGDSCMCDVGIPVNAKSTFGIEVELYTGDIVIPWSGSYIGTDSEQWTPHGLTVIIAKQYQSFTNGDIKLREEPHEMFVMGIATCGFNSPDWKVQRVKKYSDVVNGEHWQDYGFNYRK